MTSFEHHPEGFYGGPAAAILRDMADTMCPPQHKTAAHRPGLFFESHDGVITLEDRIFGIVADIEQSNVLTQPVDGEAPLPLEQSDLRQRPDDFVIDLDLAPDSHNAIYVSTPEDLHCVLETAYAMFGFTSEFFEEFGLSRDGFIARIVEHESQHADYARRINRGDLRFSVLIKPTSQIENFSDHTDTSDMLGYEAVAQVDLGGKITKLEYAAVLLGVEEPTPEDRANIRHVFGYSSVREAVARIRQHNYANKAPYLPLPPWLDGS